jgi:hypothetical protein
MALTMNNLLLFLIIPINHSLMLTMDIPIPVTMMGREIMTQNHRIATLRSICSSNNELDGLICKPCAKESKDSELVDNKLPTSPLRIRRKGKFQR